MLLPALSQARKKAKTASCTNNLKQNVLMKGLYVDDYNGDLIVDRSDTYYWALLLYGKKNNAETIILKQIFCPLMDPEPGAARTYGCYGAGGSLGLPTPYYQRISTDLIVFTKKFPFPSQTPYLADTQRDNRTPAWLARVLSNSAKIAATDIHGKIQIVLDDGHAESMEPQRYGEMIGKLYSDAKTPLADSDKVYYYSSKAGNIFPCNP